MTPPQQDTVSVILPNFNHGPYLDAALASVFAQTHTALDVIVVDDGSTDNSLEVLRPWQAKGVRVVQQPNLGASAARNQGIALAQGAYIAFLDADDLWPQRDMLESALDLFAHDPELGWTFGDAQPFALVDGAVQFMDAPYLQSGGYYTERKMVGARAHVTPSDLCNNDRFFIPTGTLLIRKRCFDEVGGFDAQLKMFEDTDMWMRLLRYPIAFYPEVLLHRRVHGSNVSHRRWAHLGDLKTLFDRYDLERYGVSYDFHAARAHYGAGRDHWAQRSFSSARSAFAQSWQHRRSWRTAVWCVLATLCSPWQRKAS